MSAELCRTASATVLTGLLVALLAQGPALPPQGRVCATDAEPDPGWSDPDQFVGQSGDLHFVRLPEGGVVIPEDEIPEYCHVDDMIFGFVY